MAKKELVTLGLVGIVVSLFVVCLVSAVQLLAPREMPFGVTGPSPVVDEVQQFYSLDIKTYSSEADVMQAAQRGDIYGGYIPGASADTLITVPAKSFFGEVLVRGGFTAAAEKSDRTLTTTIVAPLPTSDRTGAVVSLLLLPTLIGAYLVASMLFSVSKVAAVPGRIPIILAGSIVIALITGIAAGPVLGAFPTSHLWSLLPCFALVAAAVGLAAAALQGVLGKLGTLVVAVLFIVLGGASSGGAGVALLPTYWQRIGSVLPPRQGIELYRNVRYFGGNSIARPIAILVAYVLIGAVVIILVERRNHSADRAADTTVSEGRPAGTRRRLVPKDLVGPVLIALVLTTLFSLTYMSSGHSPLADNLPFGVVGSSPLQQAAQNDLFSLDLKQYSDEDSATAAMDQAKIYGALITTGTSNELVVVPSISDLSPLDIVENFKAAAEQSGQTITVKQYTPTALAPKDPYALVVATLLVALLIGGYMSARDAQYRGGTASGRYRGLWLAGFAIVTGLVVDLIATYWLEGLPSASFWIVWPIVSLIIVVVGLLAAVLRRVLGPLGIVLTVIVVLQFGNPSSGGSNGVPYLPAFWNDIGPLLPPRNAYLLLRNAIYFHGNGIAQPLAVLLVYLVVAGIIIGFLDWFRSPELSVPGVDEDTASSAAAMSTPVGPLA